MRKKILIVDDDRGIRESTKLLLELEGMQVYTNPGKDVLQEVTKLKPDVVLLDIWLVGLDGRQVCGEIKAKLYDTMPKIIMMTAGKDLKASAMESGADEFIEKPFDILHLVNRISNLHN